MENGMMRNKYFNAPPLVGCFVPLFWIGGAAARTGPENQPTSFKMAAE
jgi:hypothetical protein